MTNAPLDLPRLHRKSEADVKAAGALTIPVLVRTRDYAVLDKPAGLACHPGPQARRSVEDAFPALSRRRDGPWLAHRLDADTSGCLVVALRRAALHAAQAAFTAGRVRKTYWAIVAGRPPAPSGITEAPLAKRTTPAGWRMATEPAGLPASTAWRTLGEGAGWTWLELTPATGRTHQLRVHCAALGCPMVGDGVYGAGEGPLQLLARSVAFDELAATAPPPPHMTRYLG